MIEFRNSPFWENYVQGGGGPAEPIAAFAAHAETCGAYFSGLPASESGYRYAPEKWSVKQVLGHVTDASLIFLYRTLCIARGESKPLPGFDENAYMANA